MNGMNDIVISVGTVHDTIPDDLQEILRGNADVLAVWQSLTSLARNEWICWIGSPKLEATRQKRLRRFVEDVRAGKRRPCCWMGCVHRIDKPLSPSVKGILSRYQVKKTR